MLTYFSVTFSSMALWVPKVINHCIDWEQWNLCLAAYIFICLLTSHIIKAKPEANCDSVGKMIAHKNLTKAELNTSTLGYISTHECSEKCWKVSEFEYYVMNILDFMMGLNLSRIRSKIEPPLNTVPE